MPFYDARFGAGYVFPGQREREAVSSFDILRDESRQEERSFLQEGELVSARSSLLPSGQKERNNANASVRQNKAR